MPHASRRPGVTQTNGSSAQHIPHLHSTYTHHDSRHTRLCRAHALVTAHISIFSGHARSVDSPSPLSTQCMKLPHDKRPACTQRTPQHLTSAFSSWSPVQLRTNLGAVCNRAQSVLHIHHLIHHRPPSLGTMPHTHRAAGRRRGGASPGRCGAGGTRRAWCAESLERDGPNRCEDRSWWRKFWKQTVVGLCVH